MYTYIYMYTHTELERRRIQVASPLRQVRVAATNIMPGRRVTANDIVYTFFLFDTDVQRHVVCVCAYHVVCVCVVMWSVYVPAMWSVCVIARGSVCVPVMWSVCVPAMWSVCVSVRVSVSVAVGLLQCVSLVCPPLRRVFLFRVYHFLSCTHAQIHAHTRAE